MLETVPYEIIQHSSETEAFSYRIGKIRELIDRFKRDPKFITLGKEILAGLNPSRVDLDYRVVLRIWQFMRSNVLFRRDVNGIETLQWPEYTLEHGGDCDCQIILAGTLMESQGVAVKQAVSMQKSSNEYDHIFLIIPAVRNLIFDPTNSVFDPNSGEYNNIEVVE